MKAKKKTEKLAFKVGDHVVYPSHGVGRVAGVADQVVGELKLRCFVIAFEKDKMTLRVPVAKAEGAGVRKLSSPKAMEKAISTLKRPARARRLMWSRRAQEYESKLHSGDPVSIAEVVRDLRPARGQSEQSYSERQMYDMALDRLAREFAAIEKIDPALAAERLEEAMRAA
ncbi:MAG TPA: CarD family transcriptional regulator [Alphaproteobacteria bacterium]|nr:CarD family transcriptional regulator [Alphaproteobacteria bacterium]